MIVHPVFTLLGLNDNSATIGEGLVVIVLYVAIGLAANVGRGGVTSVQRGAALAVEPALAAHQLHDLSHHLPAVAHALMPVVDEQFPQEPWADDLGRLRFDVPAQHDEPDRPFAGVDRSEPRVRLWVVGGFRQSPAGQLVERPDHSGGPLIPDLRDVPHRRLRGGEGLLHM